MRRIGVVNLKGGSGKTTTALSLAVGMAQRLAKKKRLLLVDSDSQGNSSITMLGGRTAPPPTLRDALLDDRLTVEAIRPSRLERLDVLPSDENLADLNVELREGIGRDQRLRNALQTVETDYEVTIIDSPAQWSLLSLNILAACSELIVPVDAGIYSAMGLGRLQETVEKVRRHLAHPDLAIIGLVITRAMPNRATKDLEKHLRDAYGSLCYDSIIPYSAKVEEAHARHMTVLEYAPKSPAAVAYDALITEVLKDGRGKRRGSAKGKLRPDAA